MMLLFSGRVPLHALAQDGVLLKDLGVALGAARLDGSQRLGQQLLSAARRP